MLSPSLPAFLPFHHHISCTVPKCIRDPFPTLAGHEMKQGDRDREANVVDEAVGTLRAVAAALPWQQYHQLLGQYLRLMRRHAEGPASKQVIR